MNILPLILALVLMISVMTVERLERFKNQTIIQKEYQEFLKASDRQVFNQRQKRLYGESQRSLRQLTFRHVYDKKARERYPNEAKQYRVLIVELIKILYSEAKFYKVLEQNRPNFVEEMLTAIERASDKIPAPRIKRTKDLARVQLEDPELQAAFYHMLKGTLTRDELKEMKNPSPRMKEKAYVSLFTYINNEGVSSVPTINLALAPREILKAVFPKEDDVEAILVRRNELGAKGNDNGAVIAFKTEFNGKQRAGIDEKLLKFALSKNSAEYD